MRKQLAIKVGAVIFSGALIVVGLGQGCGKFTAVEDLGSSAQNLVNNDEDDPSINPNTPTISLVYGKQILDQFTTCIGSGLPSDRTLGMYSSKQGTISENGSTSTLTAPMLMAATSIAAEVCKDLINQEVAQKRIFIGFDFNGVNLPNDGSLQDAVRRIARSCWSRDEDPEEADIIVGNLKSVFSSASANTGHEAALFMCTSMLSSLDALTL